MKLGGVRIEPRPEWPVAALRGDVDLSNVDELATVLEGAVTNRSLGLVLDLTQVTYLDSTGLRLLFRLTRQLEDRQQSLRIVVPPDAVVQPVVVLAGLGAAVPLFPSMAEAVADLSGDARP